MSERCSSRTVPGTSPRTSSAVSVAPLSDIGTRCTLAGLLYPKRGRSHGTATCLRKDFKEYLVEYCIFSK